MATFAEIRKRDSKSPLPHPVLMFAMLDFIRNPVPSVN